MQATILIKIGNEAMQDGADLAEALRELATVIDGADMYVGISRPILDRNGDSVGVFQIDEKAEL